MKTLFSILALGFALSAFAQEEDRTIDDLRGFTINLDTPQTEAHDVHYPNYRMGGGNGAGRNLNDCLILDIRHSDVKLTIKDKMKLAKQVVVESGFNLHDPEGKGIELQLKVVGNNVVYLMEPVTLYMTYLRARTRDGRNFQDVLKDTLPPVRPGNGITPPTGLIYVRDCRF